MEHKNQIIHTTTPSLLDSNNGKIDHTVQSVEQDSKHGDQEEPLN